MRTSRVNITVPEDIVAQARAAGRADLDRGTGGGHGVVGSGGHTPNGADWAPASTERVTLILDSGGIGVLAGHRARLAELRQRDLWPPQIPAVVLTEALTGDHRRDFHENQLVRMCQVRDVTEQLARDTALLRTRSGPATTTISPRSLPSTRQQSSSLACSEAPGIPDCEAGRSEEQGDAAVATW